MRRLKFGDLRYCKYTICVIRLANNANYGLLVDGGETPTSWYRKANTMFHTQFVINTLHHRGGIRTEY